MFQFHIEEESSLPVYIQLKNAIKAAIKAGKYPSMKALPQVTQIAEHAGVSLRTADKALQELVKDGTCFRRPKKGTYVAPVDQLKSQTVCGILGNFNPQLPGEHPFEALLYCGIMESAAVNDIQTVLLNKNSEAIIRRYDRTENFDFKGVLVLDNNSNFQEAKRLAEIFPEKRFFCLNSQREEMPDNMYSVVNDDFTGAYNLVRYFASKNYKNFSILTLPLENSNITYRERIRGFVEAAKKFGLTINRQIDLKNVSQMSLQFTEAFEVIDNMLSRKEDMPEVILCVNDRLAHGALKAVQKNKLTRKIKVAGYDALLLFDGKEMVTVQVHYAEIGKRALSRLLQSDRGVVIDKIEKIEPKLVKNKGDELIYID